MIKDQQWIWQTDEWPNFYWDNSEMRQLEEQFLYQAGAFSAIVRGLVGREGVFHIDFLTNEAYKTSEIEGEILDRKSLQSSIRRNLGLATKNIKSTPAEEGIIQMLIYMYENFDVILSHEEIYKWNSLLLQGRKDLDNTGSYRTHKEAMQIVSGAIGKQKIHFQAPPSNIVLEEMNKFIQWFNNTPEEQQNRLPALTKAAITHLYFVCIHPFEDGNGRIARALVIKSLAQSLNEPIAIALSQVIHNNKKEYYHQLEKANKTCDLTKWITYFANVILQAQREIIKVSYFIIDKFFLYKNHGHQLNQRQNKVITKVLNAGPEGLKGGLNARKYKSIAKTSDSTTTRDLQDLVEKGILTSTGQGKGTRYHLKISQSEKGYNILAFRKK